MLGSSPLRLVQQLSSRSRFFTLDLRHYNIIRARRHVPISGIIIMRCFENKYIIFFFFSLYIIGHYYYYCYNVLVAFIILCIHHNFHRRLISSHRNNIVHILCYTAHEVPGVQHNIILFSL